MKTLVQFGAGAIGRSLAGALFSAAGYRVAFVDVDARVVDALNARGRYRVVIKDTLPPGAPGSFWVENVAGTHARDRDAVADAVAGADVLSTAVGGGALAAVMPAVAEGLRRRPAGAPPLSILLCENLPGAGALVRDALGADVLAEKRVGVVETSIGKMVPIMPAAVRERDPLEVWGEAYNTIVADRDGFAGAIPDVPGLDARPHFGAWVERKLYLHNFGHAAAAYLGHARARYRFMYECMDDGAVRDAVRALMHAAARALDRRHPGVFAPGDLAAHVEDLLRRFANRALADTVFRVGRDLARKLAPGDRLLGTLALVAEAGGDVAPIWGVVAAALRFDATDEAGQAHAPDAAFRARVETVGGAVSGYRRG